MEDSPLGLEAARRAGAGQIVLMGGDSAWVGDSLSLDLNTPVYQDFFQLNKTYF
ncbi:MAG: hypothetical protein GX249_12785 [Firmicutes bacterium]|nr:hypothetical protein [Bacillota bacterium]